jgi:ACR3 family arsenite transporter
MSATNCTPALNRKKLGFDSYLTLWIFLAMAIGFAIGNFFPSAEISSTPFPVELLIFLWQLGYPDDVSTIGKVKYEQMGEV